jgi:serine/threonine-protein kinase RsbW
VTKKGLEILEIKSKKTELLKVEAFLKEFFEKENLPREKFNKTLLCISEAIHNAIVHGNGGNCNKNVSIEVHCKSSELHIIIEDEGDGFNFNNMEDPTSKTNIKKESGRGIFIMKALSQNVKFNNKGNKVRLKIKL